MPENKPMDPEQAISLLDQVCAQVSLNRENHQRVLVAIGIMKNAIKNGANAKGTDPTPGALEGATEEGGKDGG